MEITTTLWGFRELGTTPVPGGLGLMHVHELPDDEVKALAGERYPCKDKLDTVSAEGVKE